MDRKQIDVSVLSLTMNFVIKLSIESSLQIHSVFLYKLDMLTFERCLLFLGGGGGVVSTIIFRLC